MSKFVTKKWVEVNDLSSGQYCVNKNIRLLRSDLFSYSDGFIVVKFKITVEGTNNARRWNKKLTFKNNNSFRTCILKTNNILIDNAEDLDIVMLMINLLEFSDNYFMTSGSLWNYYRDEVNDDAKEIMMLVIIDK